MKVRLTYEVQFNEDVEGVGTEYDALHVTVSMLQQSLREADSMDDLADVFRKFEVNPKDDNDDE